MLFCLGLDLGFLVLGVDDTGSACALGGDVTLTGSGGRLSKLYTLPGDTRSGYVSGVLRKA